ncbi:MAG TPA: UbiA family prenyltransferase [bacterium]|nr:UbiA family prenyltransferase [bacterium]
MLNDFSGRSIRWWIFLRERFAPRASVPIIGAYFGANAILAAGLAHTAPTAARVLATLLVVVLLVFLRLRIFDDIKDATRDQHEHPERPLARGLITVREAKQAATIVAFFELAFALLAGPLATAAWCIVLAYSLLMYREFFAGTWLRPRMELYAASHTLIAAWLGLFIIVAATSRWPWELPNAVWLLLGVNWATFNVFEFARKSWGIDEERPASPSYSNRWTPGGAVILTLSQALPAAAASAVLLSSSSLRTLAVLALSALSVLGLAAAAAYVVRPFRHCALIYRGTMSFFIFAIYGILLLFAAQVDVPS